MINFDFNTYNNINLENYNLEHIKEQFIADNNMAGWYYLDTDLEDIKMCATNIRKHADLFLVIGIGGSYLGSKAVIEALTPYFQKDKVEILFAGTNLSSDYLNDLLEYIQDKSVYINVISKSGNTLEPSVAFDIILEYMKKTYTDYQERIIVTTDAITGNLLKLAEEEHFKRFVVPNNIGGRYSVLTPVGLLPIAVANINIDSLFTGANAAKQDMDNCYKYTMIRDIMYKSNKIIESFNVYEPKLYYFTEWLKQLFAETQGKNNLGILPISTVNTRDLHSLGQFFQDGTPIIFSTTIFNNSHKNISLPKYGRSLNDLNKIAMESVAKAHYPHTPTSIISLDDINEYNIGYLIFFFEMSAMMGSYLLDINYYDQPGVNGYKDIMNKKIEDK